MIHVVAEIGCNWSDFKDIGEMICAAKDAKADYVKFQLFNEDTIADSPLKEKLLPLILDEVRIKDVKYLADSAKIGLVLTPMYFEAVDIAAKYADLIKIRFKDHENQELIDKALDTDRTVLISVPYRPIGQYMYHPRIKWMYCVSRNGVALYPPEPEDFNLDLSSTCDGFSSHFPHTLFDLAYAINRLPEEAYIEKHVMGTTKYAERYQIGWHPRMSMVRELPIDVNVSISFQELKIFISQLRLIERIKRIRI